jgi:hypothetical protein
VEDGIRIYYNVYAFIGNARVKARIIETAIIRARLHECLVGRAVTWYEEKLDHLMRVGLKVDLNGGMAQITGDSVWRPHLAIAIPI